VKFVFVINMQDKEAEYPHPFLCKNNDMEGTTPWLDSQVAVCVLL
jgi:hypothetical protein